MALATGSYHGILVDVRRIRGVGELYDFISAQLANWGGDKAYRSAMVAVVGEIPT